MAKMIANGLQRQVLGQKMAGTGVAQGMGAPVGGLDAQVLQPTASHVIEPAGRERADGCPEGEEDLAEPTARTHLVEVAHDGAAHFMGQRVALGAMLFGAGNRDDRVGPVDVFEPKPSHFAAAQCVNGEEQQDGAIADVPRLLTIGRRNQLPDVFPGRAARSGFVAKQAGTFDR